MGHQDDGGSYVIDDRLGDLIISGGENVDPAEVEVVLAAAPGVQEIAVLDEPITAGGRYRWPSLFVDALPRTVLGKVKRHELRAQLEPANAASAMMFISRSPLFVGAFRLWRLMFSP